MDRQWLASRATAQGLFLGAAGLFFAASAARYPIGTLARFGPGSFPLVASGVLIALSLALLARSRRAAAVPIGFEVRNIGLILLALAGFVLATKLLDMAAGITVLVFTASLAGAAYSWTRNAWIAASLIVVALAFEHLLGLRLRLLMEILHNLAFGFGHALIPRLTVHDPAPSSAVQYS